MRRGSIDLSGDAAQAGNVSGSRAAAPQNAEAAVAAQQSAMAARVAADQARANADVARMNADLARQNAETDAQRAEDNATSVIVGQGPNGPVRVITVPDGRGGTQQIVIGGEGGLGIGAPGAGMPVQGQDDIPAGVVEMMKIMGLVAVIIVVGLPIARAVGRWIDRRSATPPPASPDVARRLEAIEQAVDAVAVEVERISEGQRFATKLLSERAQPPVPEFVVGTREAVERSRG